MAPEESENLPGYEKISKSSHKSWAKLKKKKKRKRERETHGKRGNFGGREFEKSHVLLENSISRSLWL